MGPMAGVAIDTAWGGAGGEINEWPKEYCSICILKKCLSRKDDQGITHQKPTSQAWTRCLDSNQFSSPEPTDWRTGASPGRRTHSIIAGAQMNDSQFFPKETTPHTQVTTPWRARNAQTLWGLWGVTSQMTLITGSWGRVLNPFAKQRLVGPFIKEDLSRSESESLPRVHRHNSGYFPSPQMCNSNNPWRVKELLCWFHGIGGKSDRSGEN